MEFILSKFLQECNSSLFNLIYTKCQQVHKIEGLLQKEDDGRGIQECKSA